MSDTVYSELPTYRFSRRDKLTALACGVAVLVIGCTGQSTPDTDEGVQEADHGSVTAAMISNYGPAGLELYCTGDYTPAMTSQIGDEDSTAVDYILTTRTAQLEVWGNLGTGC